MEEDNDYFQKQEAQRQARIQSLKHLINDQRTDIERKIKKISASTISQRKFKGQKQQLQTRLKLFTNYSRHIIEQFFTMILDENILALTTETDIIQKIDKFKKNILGVLQKIHMNLDNDDQEGLVNIEKNVNPKRQRASLSISESRAEEARDRSRGKNSKIHGDSSADMNIWLLKNFENPYPSLEQKMEMAKKGGLSLVQVNNWFINARQRTIKKYHCKEPQLL